MKADGSQSFNFTKIISSLRIGRIVWIRGESSQGGHSWLIDGYRKVPKSFLAATSYNDYVHCNYGWSADSNGYFNVNSNSTSNLQAPNNVKIFPNVRLQ